MKSTLCFLTVMLCLTQTVLSAIFKQASLEAPAVNLQDAIAIDVPLAESRNRRAVLSQFIPVEPIQIAAPALQLQDVRASDAHQRLRRELPLTKQIYAPALTVDVPAIEAPVAQSHPRLRRESSYVAFQPKNIIAAPAAAPVVYVVGLQKDSIAI